MIVVFDLSWQRRGGRGVMMFLWDHRGFLLFACVYAMASSSSSGKPVEWIGFTCAFASPLVYAVANVLDKHVLDRRVRSVRGYVILIGLIAAVYAAAMVWLGTWKRGPISGYLFAMLSGVIFGVAGFLYCSPVACCLFWGSSSFFSRLIFFVSLNRLCAGGRVCEFCCWP
jgi:uncharacterized membrane protein